MIDVIFPTFNRMEFTRAAARALAQNTDWSLVRECRIYDDQSTDGAEVVAAEELSRAPVKLRCYRGPFGGPVAIMCEYLSDNADAYFAKVDSDTVVPPGWLNACHALRDGADLIGIECMNRPGDGPHALEACKHIGGIGLMRTAAFMQRAPEPDGRFGFTLWQHQNEHISRAWITPSLKVFLLDRLPIEPWVTLNRRYIDRGWAREWPQYHPCQSEMWDWWRP
jgi:glycosyltransferase involved in cell wall biosynthesis